MSDQILKSVFIPSLKIAPQLVKQLVDVELLAQLDRLKTSGGQIMYYHLNLVCKNEKDAVIIQIDLDEKVSLEQFEDKEYEQLYLRLVDENMKLLKKTMIEIDEELEECDLY